MAEILVRLKNYGTLVVDSLEAMRNEYVVAILHTAINITRDATGDELSMRPEYEVIGEKAPGRMKLTKGPVDSVLNYPCSDCVIWSAGKLTNLNYLLIKST